MGQQCGSVDTTSSSCGIFVCFRRSLLWLEKRKKEDANLDGNLVDLVESIDAGNVDPVPLDHVNQVVGSRVAAEHHVCVVDLVLSADGLDLIHLNVRHGHCGADVQATPLLFAEGDVGGLLVQTDPIALELLLQHPLVCQGLEHVQHHEDERARPRD